MFSKGSFGDDVSELVSSKCLVNKRLATVMATHASPSIVFLRQCHVL